MNIASMIHQPKSCMSYIYDKKTLHLRLKTQKGEVDSVLLRAIDPYNWIPTEENPSVYVINKKEMQNIEMKKEYTTKTHDVWFVEVEDPQWLRIRYAFIIEGQGEKYIYGVSNVVDLNKEPSKIDDILNYFNYPYMNEEDIYTSPDWVKDTIWCQIVVGSYSNNGDECKDKESGNFKGLIKKLDFVEDMGYTGIYLTPIFESTSWHKYDTTDYMKIDPAFGDIETFKEFLEEAHRRGMKVILDAVFNHCGCRNAFWLDVIKNGKKSKYFDCFYIMDENKPIVQNLHEDYSYDECKPEELNFRTFAYTQSMPKLNTSNPIIRNHLLDVAKYWLEVGIDGWRLDVSNEVSHDFWREFRKVVKGYNKDAYIVGENWDYAYEWLRGDQFDAVMNYRVMTPVWDFIGLNSSRINKCNASEFRDSFIELLVDYPKHLAQNMYNLVGSHDVDRLMKVCNNNTDIAKLAYLILMTFTGSPSIYYGDEIGLSGDDDNREPMVWDETKQNLELKDYIKNLIRLRKQHPSFKAVDMEFLLADNETNSIIYAKEEKDEKIFVVLHNSDKQQEIDLPEVMRGKTFREIYKDTDITLDEKLMLNPYEFYIFKQQ